MIAKAGGDDGGSAFGHGKCWCGGGPNCPSNKPSPPDNSGGLHSVIQGIVGTSDPLEIIRQLYRLYPDGRDRSTIVAAALCFRDGQRMVSLNTFLHPDMIYDPASYTRPLKYSRTVHAEEAVIASAARGGASTDGADMVGTWAACTRCARLIARAGIARLFVHKEMLDLADSLGHWREEVREGHAMLRQCGVSVIPVSGKMGMQALIAGTWYDI
jgi:deoxycytidylate deaminase